MTDFPLPEGFYADPQFVIASDAAVALYARAASWSVHHLTDGVIPAAMLHVLTGAAEQAPAELVKLGVWKRARNGFRFTAWPRSVTRESVEAKRAGNRARQESFRRSGGKNVTRYSRVSHDVSNGATNALVTNPCNTPPSVGGVTAGAREAPPPRGAAPPPAEELAVPCRTCLAPLGQPCIQPGTGATAEKTHGARIADAARSGA